MTCPLLAAAILTLSVVKRREEFSKHISPPPVLAALAILTISEVKCLEQSIRKPPPAAAILTKSDVSIQLVIRE